MADTKITALTALTAADPANDVLPIVDVSDTTMAASGTTKKISVNNILGASGTATLASATITGDLTVDTNTLKVDSANNRVGIGTATPATPLNIGTAVSRHFLANGQTTGSSYGEITTTGADVIYGAVDAAAGLFTNAIANASFFGSGNATSLQLVTNSTSRYEISSTGVATWSNVGGVAGTAMTLNSTGLGVGGSPSSKLSIFAGADGDVGFFRGGSTRQLQIGTSATAGYLNADNGSAGFELRVNGTARAYFDTSGNVGIGVTPSAWVSYQKSIDFGGAGNYGSVSSRTNFAAFATNCYFNGTDWIYKNTNPANIYEHNLGTHYWRTAASGTAGTAITFTQAMTLDASGNLLVGVTSANASGGVLQLKSGITFPATQVASSDANTLDDYEEGTWTIVVNNQLGNSATIASQIARYVKIGRRVFVFGDFTLSAKGAAAAGNLVYLGNLPFVPNSTLFEGSVVHRYDNVNLTTNGQINIISAAGGNNVCFFPISSATTGTSNLTFGQITDTTRLVFNFSYDV